jgi:hypothetical protein
MLATATALQMHIAILLLLYQVRASIQCVITKTSESCVDHFQQRTSLSARATRTAAALRALLCLQEAAISSVLRRVTSAANVSATPASAALFLRCCSASCSSAACSAAVRSVASCCERELLAVCAWDSAAVGSASSSSSAAIAHKQKEQWRL